MPSVLVITHAFLLLLATATTMPLPYVTLLYLLSLGALRITHPVPSGLVITCFPVPSDATVINRPPLYATLFYICIFVGFSDGPIPAIGAGHHTAVPVPPLEGANATNMPLPNVTPRRMTVCHRQRSPPETSTSTSSESSDATHM
jgi:hypothetical protein